MTVKESTMTAQKGWRGSLAVYADKAGFGPAARDRADAKFRQTRYPEPSPRVPLTTGQHILHLLLTAFTGGLWLPVWIFLAMRGSTRPSGLPRSESDLETDTSDTL
jgi:hypothetical protein